MSTLILSGSAARPAAGSSPAAASCYVLAYGLYVYVMLRLRRTHICSLCGVSVIVRLLLVGLVVTYLSCRVLWLVVLLCVFV